ncbi:hypothetical protein DKX38_008882 [Salix brachista]|uniref:HMA domain-containing protein n=1 Tax=Salix brachista TaxID=2182728 RepID=A0A5N5MBG7_9ROSI|nr:hypothetical protein DKX38_008882 [Salix brachista]
MVITVVDLGCEKCHKKIKKILCKIPEGHRVFRGMMVVVAAEEEVTLYVDVNISVRIIPRHAHPCKEAGKLRTPMIGVSVQHQPLDSNSVDMIDP